MADSKVTKAAKANNLKQYYKYDYDVVIAKLKQYIDSTDDPQLKEFCLADDIPSHDAINDEMVKNPPLLREVKRLLAKQEVFLTRAKDINPIMAIFRLKQKCHGFTDKQEIDQTNHNDVITVKLIDNTD